MPQLRAGDGDAGNAGGDQDPVISVAGQLTGSQMAAPRPGDPRWRAAAGTPGRVLPPP